MNREGPEYEAARDTGLRAPEYRSGRRAALGWFELDNGFFFFRSKAMWVKFCRLFLEADGIPVVPDEIPLEPQLATPAPRKRVRKAKAVT